MRPFLPAVVVGLLGRADVGVDFSGTSYAFLESWPFLGGVVAAAALMLAAERFVPGARIGSVAVWDLLLLVAGTAAGGLLFAGTLADHGYSAWSGAGAGPLCALLGWAAARSVAIGARRRLEGAGGWMVTVYLDAAAATLAAAVLAGPPLAWPALGGLVWVLVSNRRRERRKFEGLRVLR